MPPTHFPRRHPGHANRGFKSRRLQLEPLEERALLALALWDVAITIEGDPDPSTPSFSGDGTGVGRVVYNTESSDGTFLGVGDGTVTITGPDAEGKPAKVSGAIEGMGYAGSVNEGTISLEATGTSGGGNAFSFVGAFEGTTATLSREKPSGNASGRWTAHVTLPYFESPPYPDNIPGEVDLAGDWSSTTLQLVGDIDVTDDGLEWKSDGKLGVSFEVKEPLSHDSDSPWYGQALAQSATVEIYWATGETAEDIVLDPIATYETEIEEEAFSYDLEIPSHPPESAGNKITHIVMIADPPDKQTGKDRIYETNEENNVAAIHLPDVEVTSVTWTTFLTVPVLEVEYEVKHEVLTKDVELGLYWATGDSFFEQHDDIVSATDAAIHVEKGVGKHTARFYTLTAPPHATYGGAATTTHVLAVADPKRELPESDEENNERATAIQVVPPVLEQIAPGSAEKNDRYQVKLRTENRNAFPLTGRLKWNEISDWPIPESQDGRVDQNVVLEKSLHYLELGVLAPQHNNTITHNWDWIPPDNPAKTIPQALENVRQNLPTLGVDEFLRQLGKGAYGPLVSALATAADAYAAKLIRDLDVYPKLSAKYVASFDCGFNNARADDAFTELTVPKVYLDHYALFEEGLLWGAGWTTAAFASLHLPPPVNIAVALSCFANQIQSLRSADDAYTNAKDPPDPNFTEIPLPNPLTIVDAEELPDGAWYRLYQAATVRGGYLSAVSTAQNRADGAREAGDFYYESEQLMAASEYLLQASFSDSARFGIHGFMEPFLVETLAEYADEGVATLQAEGLPEMEVTYLKQLGWTDQELEVLTQNLVNSGADLVTDPVLLRQMGQFGAVMSTGLALDHLARAIQIRVNELGLTPRDLEDGERAALDSNHDAVRSMLERQIPSADLNAALQSYLQEAIRLAKESNNFDALLEHLDSAYLSLLQFQLMDTGVDALSARVADLAAQGRITPSAEAGLAAILAEARGRIVEGAFAEANIVLGSASEYVVSQGAESIDPEAADDLATWLGYVSEFNGPPPSVSITDAVPVIEGSTAVFTVTIDREPAEQVVIYFETTSSSAQEDVDFVRQAGSVVFNPGEPPSREILVPTIDDGKFEPDEVFAIVLTGSIGATVSRSEALAVIVDNEEYATLGVVDFRELKALSLAVGELRFGLTTAHAGFLTFEVANPQPAESARIHLYDENPGANPAAVPVASSSLVEGNQRLDWTVAEGQAYFVELCGENPQFDLRVVNLVHALGGGVTVMGTDGDDRFEFVPVGSHRVTINGVAYHFAEAEAQNVTFDGGDGHDTAVLRGGAGVDTVEMWPGQATLSGPGYTVAATKVETVTAVGTSEDVAVLYGSDQGGDLFSARPGSASLSGEAGFWNRAVGFGQVEAVATPGGALVDTAKFYDSDGIDLFEATPEYARMTYDDGSTARTTGFGYVVGKATAGGNDLAQLYDSPDGKDWFSGRLGYSKLYGTGFFNVALDFDRVRATATPGQFDRAAVYDSEGDDRLEATPEYARLLFGGSESAFVEAAGFPVVRAVATEGGYNTADLYDSDTGAETFVAYRDYSVLKGAGFCNYATGFSLVTGHASPDDGFDDRAKLCDSDGDDVFYAGPTSPEGTKLVAHPTSGPSYVNAAEGFYRVVAYSSEGNDRAELYDSDTSLDTFVGQPSSSSIYGPGFFHTAVGFAEVYAHASPDDGFEDRAKLYDSDGNDTFWAGPSSPEGNRLDGTTLAGHGFSYAVDGFFQIIGHSYAGGDDEARLYGADGSQDFLRAFFASDYSEMYDSATYKTTAKGFAKTTAYGVKSDADRAILYDSALDEYLEADATKDPTRAILSNSDRILEMYGFAHVKAYRSAGNDTKHVVEPLDFVLQTVGDWIDM